ncbi:MAG: dTDP-4-dehydrorhamnose reductase [Pseudomonadota bacterium]
MKILMFGKTGQVATELLRRVSGDVSLTALDRSAADLSRPGDCAARIRGSDADLIVNAAAYTAVDKAEEEPDLAMTVNGDAPGAMADEAAAKGIPFLHISTDYVFDGSGERPWTETDTTAPLGSYGRSKRAGEERVMASGADHVILRTAWVHAAHGGNFVRTMLRVGATRDRLTVVDDQYGGPTAAGDIADALLAIASAFGRGEGRSGIYHFSGAPPVSWCGFAQAIFAEAGLSTVAAPIPSSDWPTPAPRPANSRLDCARIAADYGITQPDWRVSLKAILKEIEGSAS